MRNASIAIVPIILAIMTLLWFIWIVGFESDNLYRINEVERLQHLQESLVIPAMKRWNELKKANPHMTEDDLNATVNVYINEMMEINNIQLKEVP